MATTWATRRCMQATCPVVHRHKSNVVSFRQNPNQNLELPKMADRISKLPEHLLLHILSFLTTKQAATTSVLSKQWRHLWTCVHVLDFNAKDMRTRDNKSFEQIVFKVLLSMRELQCLRKVSFYCDDRCDYVNLGYLLCALVARDLEGFDLSIEHKLVAFELPRSLLCCKTLVVLKLRGPIAIRVGSSSIEFPRLEVLCLDTVSFKDDGSVPNLLLCCPVLDELVVRNVSRSSGKFTVKSSVLKYFTYCESSSRGFAFENLDKVVRANVEFRAASTIEHWDAIVRVIRALRNVRLLDLKFLVVMQTRSCSTHSCDDLPVFHNLAELELETDCWSVLGPLLHKLPLLKNLTLVKARSGHRCWSGCRSLPPKVPNCLSFNLLAFTYKGFKGWGVEVKFTGYILKHSKALEDVVLTTPSSSDVEEMFPLLKKLLMFERASNRCRLNLVES